MFCIEGFEWLEWLGTFCLLGYVGSFDVEGIETVIREGMLIMQNTTRMENWVGWNFFAMAHLDVHVFRITSRLSLIGPANNDGIWSPV